MLIAQMVGKNEGSRYLDTVLQEIKKHVDMIVFTDDDSSDNTKEIALSHGAFVYSGYTPWTTNEGMFRQEAWNNLCNHATPGDWIIVFDCDEILYGAEALPKLMNQSQYDAIGISFYHMWNETHYRVDKAWAPTISSRMFRFQEGGFYKLSALACGAEPTYVQDYIRSKRFLAHTPLKMQHLGYMNREDHQAKYDRYMKLDQGNYHSLKHLESILDPNPELVEWKETL